MGNNMKKLDYSISNIYDKFSVHYREYSKGRNAYLNSIENLIVSNFKNKVSSILDYGSGDGFRGVKIFEAIKANTLYQADISTEMVKKCIEHGKAKKVIDVKEKDWQKNFSDIDLIISLWNVFGHLDDTVSRINLLKEFYKIMGTNSYLCLDINNRHNEEYGFLKSKFKRLYDYIAPDFNRGDVKFNWEIDDKKIPAKGHFFTLNEVKFLLETSGFEIIKIKGVSYKSGKVYDKTSKGQIFIIAKK